MITVPTVHEGGISSSPPDADTSTRVMVLPERVDDRAAQQLARQIADDVEHELTYPGRIRVTVIRETRATEMAQ